MLPYNCAMVTAEAQSSHPHLRLLNQLGVVLGLPDLAVNVVDAAPAHLRQQTHGVWCMATTAQLLHTLDEMQPQLALRHTQNRERCAQPTMITGSTQPLTSPVVKMRSLYAWRGSTMQLVVMLRGGRGEG